MDLNEPSLTLQDVALSAAGAFAVAHMALKFSREPETLEVFCAYVKEHQCEFNLSDEAVDNLRPDVIQGAEEVIQVIASTLLEEKE